MTPVGDNSTLFVVKTHLTKIAVCTVNLYLIKRILALFAGQISLVISFFIILDAYGTLASGEHLVHYICALFSTDFYVLTDLKHLTLQTMGTPPVCPEQSCNHCSKSGLSLFSCFNLKKANCTPILSHLICYKN